MTDEAEIDIIARENLIRDVLARAEDRGRENEHLVQVGMRAVIRDIQDYIRDPSRLWTVDGEQVIQTRHLSAYLLALLVTSGAYDDADDPFGALRHQMIADHGES